MPTQLSQEQLSIGDETALDLLVESNLNKTALAATLTNKGTTADPSTDTWAQLQTKAADLNVEAGRALLNIPLVSRTIRNLYGDYGNQNQHLGVAWGRWAFAWESTSSLRKFDLWNTTALPNYNTSTVVQPYTESVSVNGIGVRVYHVKQAYIRNNKAVMINATTLSVYDIAEATGDLTLTTEITLNTSVSVDGTLCGDNGDFTKFLYYNAEGTAVSAHTNFKFILADGSVTSASSVPSGTSSHVYPSIYGQDLIFSGTISNQAFDYSIFHTKHFSIDWDSLALTDTGHSFTCNGSGTYNRNFEVLVSTEDAKRYIPYHYNGTLLYCLDDGSSTTISGAAGNCEINNNNATAPSVTHLSDGGHTVMSNYGLPIFLDEDISLRYTGADDINTALIKQKYITTLDSACVEEQVYDAVNNVLYSFIYNSGLSFYAAKFKTYLGKCAGYTRLKNSITTPFFAQSTDADIEAGALDLTT